MRTEIEFAEPDRGGRSENGQDVVMDHYWIMLAKEEEKQTIQPTIVEGLMPI